MKAREIKKRSEYPIFFFRGERRILKPYGSSFVFLDSEGKIKSGPNTKDTILYFAKLNYTKEP